MNEFVGTRGEGEPIKGSDGRPYDEYSGAPFASRQEFLAAKKNTQIVEARNILRRAEETTKSTTTTQKPGPYDPDYKTVGGIKAQNQTESDNPGE